MFDGKTLEAALIDVPVTGRVSMRVQALAVRDCRPAKKLDHLTRLSSATEPCANEHVINYFAWCDACSSGHRPTLPRSTGSSQERFASIRVPFLVRSEDTFRWAGENGFHLMTLPYLYREAHMLPGFIKTYRDGLAKDA